MNWLVSPTNVLFKWLNQRIFDEVTARGSLFFLSFCFFYKHLTSIERRRDQTAHAQNRTPEKNDQRGAAQYPRNKQEREREKTGRGKEIQSSSWVKVQEVVWVVVVVVAVSAIRRGGGDKHCSFQKIKIKIKKVGSSFRHFLCRAVLELFCSVLCGPALRYQSSVAVLAPPLPSPPVGLWIPLWRLPLLVYGGSAGGLFFFFSGRRASSTFPRLSGATPRPWRCRCLLGARISSSLKGVLGVDLFGSAHKKIKHK